MIEINIHLYHPTDYIFEGKIRGASVKAVVPALPRTGDMFYMNVSQKKEMEAPMLLAKNPKEYWEDYVYSGEISVDDVHYVHQVSFHRIDKNVLTYRYWPWC